MKKTVGILGGMGPLATAYFYEKLILRSPAKSDQDHIPVMIYANPTMPDRTQCITQNQKELLSPHLIKGAQSLESNGAELICMPCNTAHFWYDVVQNAVSIPVIHLIEETGRFLSSHAQNPTIGLLATHGTIQSQLYPNTLQNFDLSIQLPSSEDQHTIMSAIHTIKSGAPPTEQQPLLMPIVQSLLDQNIDHIILGCTELPLIFGADLPEFLTDPMDCLADAIIQQVY